MPAQTSIHSECHSYCLTDQEYYRNQYAIIIWGKTSADLESRDQAGKNHDDRNDEENIAGDHDNWTTVISSQLLKSWRLRRCVRRHSDRIDQGIDRRLDGGRKESRIAVYKDQLFPEVESFHACLKGYAGDKR